MSAIAGASSSILTAAAATSTLATPTAYTIKALPIAGSHDAHSNPAFENGWAFTNSQIYPENENMTQIEAVNLEYREGGSDKVYHAWIEPQGNGFVVNFSHARRGANLTTGTKTKEPVVMEAAQIILRKLVKEKTGKGYTAMGGGTPVMVGGSEKKDTGLRPQLLNDFDDDEHHTRLNALLSQPDVYGQPKHDGHRVLIISDGRDVTATNRKGEERPLPEEIAKEIRLIAPWGRTVFDGELVGTKYFCFDLLAWSGQDITLHGYEQRLAAIPRFDGCRYLHKIATAAGAQAKVQMLQDIIEMGLEGMVFKDRSARYTAGRPASGGPQLKYKLKMVADVVMTTSRSGKRSMGMSVYNGSKEVKIGNVTIPANRAIPHVGAVCQVEYLYAFDGGSLFQPVFDPSDLGARSDKLPIDCQINQLKFKAAAEEDGDEA